MNQVMGDGIMALFGAPLAHEDHAVRACYAALRMQESVAQYAEGVFRSHGRADPDPRGAQLRRGGRPLDRQSDLHMDYTAVGQTTHLAARMEQMATPGTHPARARDAPARRRLRAGHVARGPVAVKGLPDARRDLRAHRSERAADAAPGGRRAGTDAVRRPRRRDRAAPPGAGAGARGPRPDRRRRGGARRGQVAPRLGVHPLPPRRRTGSSWKRAPCPTARRPATCPSSISSRPTSRSTTATTPARSARR